MMSWGPFVLQGWIGNLLAIAGLSAVIALATWLEFLSHNTPFILVYPVVFLTAWFLGRTPALFVILLGTLGASYWLLEPTSSLLVVNPGDRGRIITFVAVSLVITQLLHKSREYYIKLRLSEARYLFATTVAQIGTWEWDLAKDVFHGSAVLTTLYDLKQVDSVFAPEVVFAQIHPEDQGFVRQRMRAAIDNHEMFNSEFRIITRKGEIRWLLGQGRCEYGKSGEPLHLIGTNTDITDLKKAESALRESERQYHALAETVPVGIFRTDSAGGCVYANERWLEITGLPREEMYGDGWKKAVHPDDAEYIWALWDTTTKQARKFEAEYRFIHRTGHVSWVSTKAVPENGNTTNPAGYVGAVMDITDRKHYEESLRRQATTDTLTGLANRAAAMERLELELDHVRDHVEHVALMFIDLDNFKHVNDTLGHQTGDQLLIHTAHRLRHAVGEHGLTARFAGDEFLILLSNLRHAAQIEHVAQRVIETFAPPLHLADGSEAFITCSMGIAVSPEDGTNVEKLLRHADIALYKAKQAGRNNYQFFLESMNVQLQARRRMELNLRHAMENNELKLFYQPILDCGNGQLVGFEALLRWDNPELGSVSPEQFVPLAEETGLIKDIGSWVLSTACQQLKEWQTLTDTPLTLAVNISSRQFYVDQLPSTVKGALDATGLEAQYLELELTERAFIPNDQQTESGLRQLHAQGVRFSVDDFGTGYSNLSYFQRLPLHSLKLDKSFLLGVPADPNNTALARSIIAMSHNLGLSVIAEGIENQEQWAFLQNEGCNFAQGFHFATPMSVEAAHYWLTQRQMLH